MLRGEADLIQARHSDVQIYQTRGSFEASHERYVLREGVGLSLFDVKIRPRMVRMQRRFEEGNQNRRCCLLQMGWVKSRTNSLFEQRDRPCFLLDGAKPEGRYGREASGDVLFLWLKAGIIGLDVREQGLSALQVA